MQKVYGESEMKMKRFFVQPILGLFLTAGLSGCHPYKKEVPTGSPLVIDSVYSNPSYDHSALLNVYCLPVENRLQNPHVLRHQRQLVQALLRNFGKFHYFNLQFDPGYVADAERLVDLDSGRINRAGIGIIGQEFNAQAVLKVSISEYRPFFPMVLKMKAALIDTNSGETIWKFDEVFDADDTEVVNGMRYWWNTHMAGGDEVNRFSLSKLRPGFFMNYVFSSMAESYGRARNDNVRLIKREERNEERKKRDMERRQEWSYGEERKLFKKSN